MKLDTTHLRYLTPEDWRVLTAVETGSKNHEIVPTPLISRISNLRSGSGAHRSISTLAKANLIARVQHAKYDGYRLTYGGLDYLALHAHFQRKALHSTGQMIGTGKESDIHIALSHPPPPPSSTAMSISSAVTSRRPSITSQSTSTLTSLPSNPHPTHHKREVILKIHRLGRISFRSIKTNRDYLRHRTSATWLHMSKLSAFKEYVFMRALHSNDFPVPTPIAHNRHTVVMSLIQGTPLYQIRHLQEWQARGLYAELMALIVRLAHVGLIHGDFNEFNIMVEEHEQPRPQPEHTEAEGGKGPSEEGDMGESTLCPVLIDFPQMLSISHPNASMYFDRDVDCVKRYFSRRYHFTSDDPGPFLSNVEKQMRKNGKNGRRLDVEVEASGFLKKMAKELEKYMEEVGVEVQRKDGDGSPESDGPDEFDEGSEQGKDEERTADVSFGPYDPDADSLENGQALRAAHEAASLRGVEGLDSQMLTARMLLGSSTSWNGSQVLAQQATKNWKSQITARSSPPNCKPDVA
ncbi:MAG: hypothetical protein Q9184_003989 [Pyrenodesmia sp. 2 TL-2023]